MNKCLLWHVRKLAVPDKLQMNLLMPTFLLRSPTLLDKNALPSAVIVLLCTRQLCTDRIYTRVYMWKEGNTAMLAKRAVARYSPDGRG